MELTNKRESYSVTNSNEELTLQGEVTIFADSLNLSGNISNSDNISVGSFNYRESGGTVDKTFYGMPEALQSELFALLDTTVSEIKLELDA